MGQGCGEAAAGSPVSPPAVPAPTGADEAVEVADEGAEAGPALRVVIQALRHQRRQLRPLGRRELPAAPVEFQLLGETGRAGSGHGGTPREPRSGSELGEGAQGGMGIWDGIMRWGRRIGIQWDGAGGMGWDPKQGMG